MNKTGVTINGFILKEEEFVADIDSNVRIFEHEKTGAKLMHIENDDDNKSFTIGFKTPPKDNTGEMHILEHSVLCGSRKFPTKEPFVELCKGSMKTFLNAITYSDKTVYPISSRNEKDFLNLMDVYLDAVFYPNIYKNDKIFKQEGWHYHLENKDDNIEYKGVVYNEMKGYFSSPFTNVYRLIEPSLFPNNAYSYESGGIPNEIPQLTYEQFLNTHKKLYHPSNSYIALYGNLNLEKTLDFIDKEYLSNFDKKEIDSNIEKEKPFDERKESIFNYSVSNENQLSNQSYLALNTVVDSLGNTELNLAMHILSTLLTDSEEAPLKQALLDTGLGDDVFAIYNDEVLQPYLSIILKDSSLDKKDAFLNTVKETLIYLVKKGINKDLIEGCINMYEFSYREGDTGSTPKGLSYSLSAIGSWIHGKSPIEKLKFEKHFKNIKKALTEPYFENIIEKYILNNNHSSLVILEPKLNMNKEDNVNLKNKLFELKNNLSNEELDFLVKDTLELLEYQEKEDSQEDLNKIPMLSIDDIEKEVEELKVEEYDIEGTKLLHYDTFAGGINYISTMFDVRGVKEDDISYIGLISDLLTRVGTKDKTYIELSNDIMKNVGELSFYTKEYFDKENPKLYTPLIECSCKVLVSKTNKAIELMLEIMNSTSFEDEKRIKEIIKEKISELEITMIEDADNLAMSKMASYFNPMAKYNEKISGLEYYKFLKELNENIDENIKNIKEKLYEIKEAIFDSNNMIVTFVGSKDELNNIECVVKDLNASLSNCKIDKYNYSFNEEILNEGILIPSEVQYVAKGYNYKMLGYEYNGSMEVLKNTLKFGYLWNKIRVQGGAYGAMFNITESGNVILCTYRDPNIVETLQAYDNMPSYIENIDLNSRELNKSIIGTLSAMQLPTLSYKKGKVAIGYYLMGKTKLDRQKQRNEVLNTSVESLRSLSKLMNDVINKECIVVVGNDKINEHKELFNNISNPLK